jgi:histidinol phosphatase-like PHP family hydrolase
MHAQWSDGSGSIAGMADAAGSRYEYIAITDHSKGLKIAVGIDENQLQKQASEVATVNENLKSAGQRIRVLHSIELNLDPQSKGDMEGSLENLYLVLGCFHSALRRKEDETDRYSQHWEIQHQDLRIHLVRIDLVRLAKKSGCRISLGTDSHHPSQLRFIELGLASALIAGVKHDRILCEAGRGRLEILSPSAGTSTNASLRPSSLLRSHIAPLSPQPRLKCKRQKGTQYVCPPAQDVRKSPS